MLFLYGVQGMLGGFFSSVFTKIASVYESELYPTAYAHYALREVSGPLVATGISIGIGVGVGVIVGILLNLVNKEVALDHYHDRSYWIIERDCIST